jgi:glutaredoxin
VTRAARLAAGLLVLLCLLCAPARAQGGTASGETVQAAPTLVVFVREGCPHCADAKVFLRQLASERPALRIHLRAVDEEPEAARELSELSQAAGVWPPGVPTFVFGDLVLVGFDDAEHRGRELRALVDGALQPGGAAQPQTRFGALSASHLGLPLFTLVLGLLDGFNPCAMWVLLFLLSLLVHLHERRRMVLIAGTFVLVSGAVYYAFMAAWLNVFLAVGLSQPVRVLLALVALAIGAFNVKDFVAWGRGPSIGIPEAAKPRLYARMRGVVKAQALTASLLGVAALAVVVNLVELLCTAGIPAMFTAVLSQQELSPATYYGYLGLYILGYVADDTLMVGSAVIALGGGRLGERGGRRLKLLSGCVMLMLGAVLLLRPQWLL